MMPPAQRQSSNQETREKTGTVPVVLAATPEEQTLAKAIERSQGLSERIAVVSEVPAPFVNASRHPKWTESWTEKGYAFVWADNLPGPGGLLSDVLEREVHGDKTYAVCNRHSPMFGAVDGFDDSDPQWDQKLGAIVRRSGDLVKTLCYTRTAVRIAERNRVNVLIDKGKNPQGTVEVTKDMRIPPEVVAAGAFGTWDPTTGQTALAASKDAAEASRARGGAILSE